MVTTSSSDGPAPPDARGLYPLICLREPLTHLLGKIEPSSHQVITHRDTGSFLGELNVMAALVTAANRDVAVVVSVSYLGNGFYARRSCVRLQLALNCVRKFWSGPFRTAAVDCHK